MQGCFTLAVALAIITLSSAALCPDVLDDWWGEGCIWTGFDNQCSVRPMTDTVYSVVYNTVSGCGWGDVETYYNCGENDDRVCNSLCYKPCPGETVRSCTDVEPTSCSKDIVYLWNEPCKNKCGTDVVVAMYYCPEPTGFIHCEQACCCERCTGSGIGTQLNQICTNEMLAASYPSWDCPKINNP